MKESGWGEFQIQIRIYFTNPDIKPLFLSHQLKLYADDGSTGVVVSERFDKICLDESPGLEVLSNICKSIEIACTDSLILIFTGPEEEHEYEMLSQVLNNLKGQQIGS